MFWLQIDMLGTPLSVLHVLNIKDEKSDKTDCKEKATLSICGLNSVAFVASFYSEEQRIDYDIAFTTVILAHPGKTVETHQRVRGGIESLHVFRIE